MTPVTLKPKIHWDVTVGIRVAPFCKFCRKVLLHTTFLDNFDALISKMSSDLRNSQ